MDEALASIAMWPGKSPDDPFICSEAVAVYAGGYAR